MNQFIGSFLTNFSHFLVFWKGERKKPVFLKVTHCTYIGPRRRINGMVIGWAFMLLDPFYIVHSTGRVRTNSSVYASFMKQNGPWILKCLHCIGWPRFWTKFEVGQKRCLLRGVSWLPHFRHSKPKPGLIGSYEGLRPLLRGPIRVARLQHQTCGRGHWIWMGLFALGLLFTVLRFLNMSLAPFVHYTKRAKHFNKVPKEWSVVDQSCTEKTNLTKPNDFMYPTGTRNDAWADL